MSFLDRLKVFTGLAGNAGLSKDELTQAFGQFEANELLRDPTQSARFFLDNVILNFDFEYDKTQNQFAAKYLSEGVFTKEMFARAINEEVLLRTLGVLLVFEKNAHPEYFQRFFERAATQLTKRMSEQVPGLNEFDVETALKKYLGAFKGQNASVDFSTLYANRVCGDDPYGSVVRALLLADANYVLLEFKWVVDIFSAVEHQVEMMTKPPLSPDQA